MKKIFGGINLTWPRLIVMAIIVGIYTALIAMFPIAKDTSFSDIAVTFEVWIFFGIFIIMNSKSAMDSALKCLTFFVISQPIIYLVQDLINHSNLFDLYYSNWILWTIACFPMGFIGYYMKKNKWWGLLILIPVLALLGYQLSTYFSETMFSFPRHLLTTIFCMITLIIYPLFIFDNKKIKIVGTITSIIIIISMIIWSLSKPNVYSTDILFNGDDYHFDNTYKVYLADDKYGKLSIEYQNTIEDYLVHAEFKKAGNTEFTLESPDGKKRTFNLVIKSDTYSVDEKK